MEWLLANWGSVIEIILMVLGVGSIVAKWTPNKWDDNFFGKAINIVGLAKKK